MAYTVTLSTKAAKQIAEIKKTGDRIAFDKIQKILLELREHPATGTGQVEQLKGNLAGLWSRRINKQHRLIYSIHEEIVTVEVVSVRGHYGQK